MHAEAPLHPDTIPVQIDEFLESYSMEEDEQQENSILTILNEPAEEEAAGQAMEDSMDDISRFELLAQSERERGADQEADFRAGSISSTASERGLVSEPGLRIPESIRQAQSYTTRPTWECHIHDHMLKYARERLEKYQRPLGEGKEFPITVRKQQPKQREIISSGVSPTCGCNDLDKHAFILDPHCATSPSTTNQCIQSDTRDFTMNSQSTASLHSIKGSDNHICTVGYTWAWKDKSAKAESTCEIKLWGYIIPTDEEVETLNSEAKTAGREALTMMNKRKAPRLCIPLPDKPLSDNLPRCHIDNPPSAEKQKEEMEIRFRQLIATALAEKHRINFNDPAVQKTIKTVGNELFEEFNKQTQSHTDQLCTSVREGRPDWPDYVFEKGFRLPTVRHIEKQSGDFELQSGVISASDRIEVGGYTQMAGHIEMQSGGIELHTQMAGHIEMQSGGIELHTQMAGHIEMQSGGIELQSRVISASEHIQMDGYPETEGHIEMQSGAGNFEAEREGANVLKYVEMKLHWIFDAAKMQRHWIFDAAAHSPREVASVLKYAEKQLRWIFVGAWMRLSGLANVTWMNCRT